MQIYDLALSDRIFITNSLEGALLEIDLCFNTTNTELIGNTKYGTNFELFLWVLKPDVDSVKQYITEKLDASWWLTLLIYHVDVQYLEGDYRGVYYVKITVEYRGKVGIREYQFR